MYSHGLKFSQSYRYSKSKGYNNSIWEKDVDSMSLKTILKLTLSSFADLSIEMQQAITSDQGSIPDMHDLNKVDYVDNTEDIPLVVVKSKETVIKLISDAISLANVTSLREDIQLYNLSDIANEKFKQLKLKLNKSKVV